MKKVFFTISILFCLIHTNAQDTIYTSAQKYILAKVIEVDKRMIIYKKYANIDGPNYRIAPQSVYQIVYENGSTETYNQARNKNVFHTKNTDNRAVDNNRTARIIRNKERFPRDKNHNLLSTGFYLQDLYSEQIFHTDVPRRVNGSAQGFFIQYERLLLKEIVGVHIMPMIGLNQNQLGIKAGVKAYTKFFGRSRVSLGINYSLFKQAFNKSFYNTNTTGWPARIVYTDQNAIVGNLSFNSNFLYHITPQTLLQFSTDIGSVIHINKSKNLPGDWMPRSEMIGTMGMLSLGVARRF